MKEKKKLIYIYNTHDQEKYKDNTRIIDVSKMLSNNLKKLGIDSIVEEKRVSEYQGIIQDDYKISRMFLEERNEDIAYYIDVHRDSVNNTTIEIDGKKYAKILFVLGLDNPYYENNKGIMEKMHNYLETNYPNLSKGIYEKSGVGVNGVYNQDFNKHTLLIEVGGIENSYDEVYNSTEIIALMIYSILGDN
jgi:stage II sporulation protein P